jgi:hypothetical protein
MTLIAITPEASLNPGQLKLLRDTACSVAQSSARGASNADLTTRPLTPTDWYGSQAAVFGNGVAVTANVPTKDSAVARVPQATAWVLFGYGVLYPSATALPSIQEIWIGTAAQIFAKIRLDPLYAEGAFTTSRGRMGYFDPIYFMANAAPQITYVTSNNLLAANAETYALVGVVAEPPLTVVNQPQIAPGQPASQAAG